MPLSPPLSNDQLQLEIFRRKYLQMEDPLEINYPAKEVIKPPAAQAWLVENLFNKRNLKYLPTARYTYRVMKKLLSILEDAMEDPEEDEISDDLISCFCEILAKAEQDEMESVQEKCPVTYIAPILERDAPTVTILEAPFLLAYGGTTGTRTWAAALYLGTYLITNGRHFIENHNLLELGAGLGFLSILCGKHLGARHVLMTDGSDTVMALAQDNVYRNGVEHTVVTTTLEWGSPYVDDEDDWKHVQYDLVLAADILYEPEDFPALMLTLEDLFSRSPHLQMLMSTVVRAEATLESFLDACSHSFQVQRLEVPVWREHEQTGFFHSTFDPIHVYLITVSQGETSSDESIHEGYYLLGTG
ncbi:MAG: hypothetical protein LQ338_005265 [Usnochroma carphineum]|nr:MAG: hypothetical protein LQ338_005265 [Usnochroma carphineum]